MKVNFINQKRALELLDYDPVTGFLKWKSSGKGRKKGREQVGSIMTNRGGKSYRKFCFDGNDYLAHRVIWVMMTGNQPIEVDHEDGDGLNNKWLNLREVTHQENKKNQRVRCDNETRINGVNWSKREQRWRARITADGKDINLGYFKDIDEAKQVRIDAEVKYGFHKNHGSDRPL